MLQLTYKIGEKVQVSPTLQLQNMSVSSKLNWLRAGVLGANDGIVSTAGLVIGVASATNSQTAIVTAGIAGVIAGAISMAAGEYVSVSSQRDTERALIAREKIEIETKPREEEKELATIYQEKGLSKAVAKEVAEELTALNPIQAHLDAELGIKESDLANPIHAAISSAGAFIAGAAIPLITIILVPTSYKILITFISVLAALFVTGYVSAQLGHAGKRRAVLRVVIGGAIAMIATYAVGKLFHVTA